MALADRCDAFVVIGSANSSNTNALAKLATEAGCRRVLLACEVDAPAGRAQRLACRP